MMKCHKDKSKFTFRVYLFTKNTTNNSINHWFFPLTMSVKRRFISPKNQNLSNKKIKN